MQSVCLPTCTRSRTRRRGKSFPLCEATRTTDQDVEALASCNRRPSRQAAVRTDRFQVTECRHKTLKTERRVAGHTIGSTDGANARVLGLGSAYSACAALGTAVPVLMNSLTHRDGHCGVVSSASTTLDRVGLYLATRH